MLRWIRRFRVLLLSLLLLTLPFVVLRSYAKRPSDVLVFDRIVLFFLQPIQQATYLLTYGFVHGIKRYVYLVGVQQQNEQLLQNQLAISQKLHQTREIEAENVRLRSLLNLMDRTPFFRFAAEVIARDATQLFRSIRVNKGERQGVERGMAVITNEGVVGHVVRIFPNFSDIALLTDTNTSIDAVSQRSRVRGIVVGYEGNKAAMKYVLRSDDIRPGDLIVTSGMGGFYPKGLPIGTVTRTDRVKYDIAQFVEISPSVNFSKLEEVFLLRRPTEQEIQVASAEVNPISSSSGSSITPHLIPSSHHSPSPSPVARPTSTPSPQASPQEASPE